MNKQPLKRVALCLAVAIVSLIILAASARPLYALPNGISGYSGAGGINCSLCHEGGATPQVAVSGDNTIAPGAMVQLLLHITSTNPASQTHAGWNVTVRDSVTNDRSGTISIAAGDTTSALRDDELIHAQPLANQNGAVIVPFVWTAPITPGLYTVFFAGNSVNNSSVQRDTNGDAAESGTLQITVDAPVAIALAGGGVSMPSQQAATALIVTLIILTVSLLRKNWIYRQN